MLLLPPEEVPDLDDAEDLCTTSFPDEMDMPEAEEGDGAIVMLEDVLAVLAVRCFAAKLWSLAGMEFNRCCW